MGEITTINGIDITTLASFNGVSLLDGQAVNAQEVVLSSGDHTLISTSGAISTGTSSVSFTTGIDTTYDVYEWHFINMLPVNSGFFRFQVNRTSAGVTSWNSTHTNAYLWAYHKDDDTASSFSASTTSYPGYVQRNSTYYAFLGTYMSNVSGDGLSGILKMYSPHTASYPPAKHYTVTSNLSYASRTYTSYAYGYFGKYLDWDQEIDQIDFKFDSGNISSGEIRMYGYEIS